MSKGIANNKPAMVVAGTGLVLFIGLTAFGFMINSDREAVDKQINDNKKVIVSAQKAGVTPSRAVCAKLEEDKEAYINALKKVEANFAPYVAASALQDIAPNAFQNNLKANRSALIAKCREKGILITDASSWLGLQDYSTKAPAPSAAPALNFQMLAINELVNQMTGCGVTKFIKVCRPDKISQEKPKVEDDSISEDGAPTWEGMPVEIVFEGDRKSLMNVMNLITENKKYLFTVNVLRVRNERNAPLPLPQATTPPKPASAPTESVTPADELAAAQNNQPVIEEVIRPYMGNEKVSVLLSLNLVHFTAPAKDGENEQN